MTDDDQYDAITALDSSRFKPSRRSPALSEFEARENNARPMVLPPPAQPMRELFKKTLFFTLCVALVPLAVHFLLHIGRVVHDRQASAPADYQYPAFSDLWLTGVSLLFFLPGRYVLTHYVFERLADAVLPPVSAGKWGPQARHDRVQRFATVLFKFLYFVCVTTFGWWLLLATNYMPPALGGDGDVLLMWEDFPYPPQVPWLREYYLIELGYHVQSLLYHVAHEHRNDFLEMLLHHTAAMLLVCFSYFCNFVRVGSLVLLVHDIADVVGYAVKTSVDTSYTILTLSIYMLLLVVWAWTRFFVFPFVIIREGIFHGYTFVPPEHYIAYNWNFLTGMLFVLVLLHVYWYALFLYMGYSYIVTGVTQDLQQKVGDEVDPKKLTRKQRKQDKHAPKRAIESDWARTNGSKIKQP